MRARRSLLVAATVAGALLAAGLPSATTSSATTSATSARAAARADIVVGSLTLHPCAVLARAYCGKLRLPWDPTGAVPGTIGVGFAFVRAHDRSQPARGTLVPREGGPGYSTTGSASDYAQMYGRLMEHRNLLLVDQRGTGRSEPIDCPELQNAAGAAFRYGPAAGRCAQTLGDHANLYGTALSADDLAAVIAALQLGKVDLYGDSYGTFFAAVFAGRHGDLLRSVVLDSAYPPTGETAWYPTQGPAMLRSIDLACDRTPSCARAGAPTSKLLARVLARVRKAPIRGVAADADGVLRHITVDAPALVTVAFGATYGPASYTELPGVLRSALAGYKKPLLRLTAESISGGSGGDPVDYSEGLDAAVSCHDYPQLYDMTATPQVRKTQYGDAVRAEVLNNPKLYAPFTIREYLRSDWQMADWCLEWPVAPSAHPSGPPAPPSGVYPSVPTLVLSGELDSITTPAEGSLIANAFPLARHVLVANSFHVTAVGDTDRCAVHIVRHFVSRPRHGLSARRLACANQIPPLRAVAEYHRSFRDFPAARPLGSPGSKVRLHAGAVAVRTGADLLDRWFNNYSGSGHGLRGGRWSYTGDRVVHFRVKKLRLTKDLAVSGRVTWSRYGHLVTGQLTLRQVHRSGTVVRGSPVNGSLTARWDSRARGARALIRATLGGRSFTATMRAP